MEKTFFVEILLPLPLPNTFTYRVPRHLADQVREGKRVIVQFGRKKLYSGLIVEVHHQAPRQYEAKYLLSILDDESIVFPVQLRFWKWMANYYLCTEGEVLAAALPNGLKLSSESSFVKHPDYEGSGEELSDKEFLVLEAFQTNQTLTLTDIQAIIDQKTVYSITKSLIEKQVILEEQELKRRFKPKKETYYKLGSAVNTEEKLRAAFDELDKAPKQFELLALYMQLSAYFKADEPKPIKKRTLKQRVNTSDSTFKQLEEKNIFQRLELEESRLELDVRTTEQPKELTAPQQVAYEEIKMLFQEMPVCLLQGVTSSGKTELYVKLIEEQLKQGKQVLYLLPEIALTTQLIKRLKRYFGDQVGIFHSKFNENERVEVWLELLKKEASRFQIIIGARSAIFLPFYNLGLIIVDEEHETTFKQFDPAPRFHARDSAVVLGQLTQAPVLLGTATPSFESYINAKEGKYGWVKLKKRYKNVALPEIQTADLKKERKERLMKGVFSSFLVKEMEETIKENQQVILFKNRRGFSPFMQCITCGHVPHCTRCDISLTYHKYTNTLNCHYCGYKLDVPKTCSSCGSKQLRTMGFGTERMEEELQILFPTLKIARLDLDTTRSKHAYKRIIEDFENEEIQVLIGTQMISKGLDFRNVSLVGIVDADSMISFPDFRAHEKAYHLMSQVAGRAGRTLKRGKVIVQTSSPYHFVIQKTMEQDFIGFADQLLLERKRFLYPPYYRIVKLTCKHVDKEKVEAFAEVLAKQLKAIFKDRVIGPEYPPVARIRNQFLKNILIKLNKSSALKEQKRKIVDLKETLIAENKFPPYGVIVDVDPL